MFSEGDHQLQQVNHQIKQSTQQKPKKERAVKQFRLSVKEQEETHRKTN
jgi:hypothetical protein